MAYDATMSFDFNYKFWVSTKKDIDLLIRRQNVLKRLEPIENPLFTYKLFSELYILYVELVNKLGYLYSNTFQVQKRAIVRDLVEAATRRLMEMKNELKNLELSEYVYTDDVLIKRKLTPNDLVIWRSPNFLYRRPPELQNIVYENKIFMDEVDRLELEHDQELERREAIITIQAHERARQGRVYLANIKYDKKKYLKIRMHKVSYTLTYKPNQAMGVPVKRTIYDADFLRPSDECQAMLNEENLDTRESDVEARLELERQRDNAARTIQRAWHAHCNQRSYKKKLIYRETLYGMKKSRKLVKPNAYSDSVIEMYKKEMLKKQLDDAYVKLITDERTRLLQQRTPWIMEDISDHIRAWFKEFYDATGAFHPYPDVLKSGTVLVVIDESMDLPEFGEYLLAQGMSKADKQKAKLKAKQQKAKEKAKLKMLKLKEAKRRKKMKDAGIYDIADELINNKNIQLMEKTIKQYSVDWHLVDEYLNKNHEAIKDWVTEGELAIIHRELRMLVDEFMRVEYELLRQALCIDQKKKYKKPKVKKPKQPKGKKKKKEKDLTANRPLESLYMELKEDGIIENYTHKDFDAFVAEFNFTADDLRDMDHLTTTGPAKGDIKMVIQESLLGMGEFKVDKPKSLCLVGPLNNGKKLLVNIIASELDAVFMNISPEKTSTWGDNLNYYMHIVMKVARAFQPTILFIGDCHRVWWKKLPKDMDPDLNPRMLQPVIMKKIIKQITKDDKIMLVGTTDLPWSAKPALKKVFQKILLVPQSDYGTSFLLWLAELTQAAGDDCVDDYMISALAKVLQHYNSGDVANNVAETLDVRRRMRLPVQPLDPNEFLAHFIDKEKPLFPAEEKIVQKYNKWFNKANKLCKLRAKFLKAKAEKGKKKK